MKLLENLFGGEKKTQQESPAVLLKNINKVIDNAKNNLNDSKAVYQYLQQLPRTFNKLSEAWQSNNFEQIFLIDSHLDYLQKKILQKLQAGENNQLQMNLAYLYILRALLPVSFKYYTHETQPKDEAEHNLKVSRRRAVALYEQCAKIKFKDDSFKVESLLRELNKLLVQEKSMPEDDLRRLLTHKNAVSSCKVECLTIGEYTKYWQHYHTSVCKMTGDRLLNYERFSYTHPYGSEIKLTASLWQEKSDWQSGRQEDEVESERSMRIQRDKIPLVIFVHQISLMKNLDLLEKRLADYAFSQPILVYVYPVKSKNEDIDILVALAEKMKIAFYELPHRGEDSRWSELIEDILIRDAVNKVLQQDVRKDSFPPRMIYEVTQSQLKKHFLQFPQLLLGDNGVSLIQTPLLKIILDYLYLEIVLEMPTEEKALPSKEANEPNQQPKAIQSAELKQLINELKKITENYDLRAAEKPAGKLINKYIKDQLFNYDYDTKDFYNPLTEKTEFKRIYSSQVQAVIIEALHKDLAAIQELNLDFGFDDLFINILQQYFDEFGIKDPSRKESSQESAAHNRYRLSAVTSSEKSVLESSMQNTP